MTLRLISTPERANIFYDFVVKEPTAGVSLHLHTEAFLCHEVPKSTFYSTSETLHDRQNLARRRPHVPVKFVLAGEFFSPHVET